MKTPVDLLNNQLKNAVLKQLDIDKLVKKMIPIITKEIEASLVYQVREYNWRIMSDIMDDKDMYDMLKAKILKALK